MRKLFTFLTFATCLLAFLILTPAAPQQEVEVLPILKAEAPKLEAIKNDPSLSGMQKMKQLHAIHSENAPQLQKILSTAQYQ